MAVSFPESRLVWQQLLIILQFLEGLIGNDNLQMLLTNDLEVRFTIFPEKNQVRRNQGRESYQHEENRSRCSSSRRPGAPYRTRSCDTVQAPANQAVTLLQNFLSDGKLQHEPAHEGFSVIPDGVP